MVGWHHQLKGLEFEQTQGNSEGQGNLACYSPWHHTQKSQTWLSDWTTTTMPRQRRLPNIPQKPEIPLQLVASLLSSSLCTKTIFILSCPLLLLPSIFPSIRVFSSGFFESEGQSIGDSTLSSVLPMNIQDWFPLRFDLLDLLAVHGTLKSLLQHHSPKASILLCSAFFTGKSFLGFK